MLLLFFVSHSKYNKSVSNIFVSNNNVSYHKFCIVETPFILCIAIGTNLLVKGFLLYQLCKITNTIADFH